MVIGWYSVEHTIISSRAINNLIKRFNTFTIKYLAVYIYNIFNCNIEPSPKVEFRFSSEHFPRANISLYKVDGGSCNFLNCFTCWEYRFLVAFIYLKRTICIFGVIRYSSWIYFYFITAECARCFLTISRVKTITTLSFICIPLVNTHNICLSRETITTTNSKWHILLQLSRLNKKNTHQNEAECIHH